MKIILNGAVLAATLIAPSATLADWTGYYVGLGFGQSSNGSVEVGSLVPETDISDSNMSTAFLGYQRQFGQYVMGGEVAFATAPDAEYTDKIFGAAIDGPVVDVKYRVGYAVEKFQPYAIIGTSFISAEGDNVSGLVGVGLNAGLGLDYMISDNFTVGAEYLARFTSGVAEDLFYGGEYDVDIRMDSLTLRAAYKF